MKVIYGLAIGGVAAVCAAAQAASLMAVSTSSSPDMLMRFDTADPATTATPMYPTEANFIRGMDMLDANNGYYLSMKSTDAGPAGLYRMQDGESVRMATVPFETSAIGDMTFAAREDEFYAALHTPGVGMELYTIDMHRGFVAVGRIMVAGSGSADVAGLALDPVSGTLYGLDNRTNSLIMIDAEDGSALRIGDGLGVMAFGAGAMDFALDGSELYMTTNNGKVYTVDPQTGAAGPMMGTLPFATGALAAVPEPASLLLLALGGLLLGGHRSR